MSSILGVRITRKRKITLGLAMVAGAATAVYIGRKYDLKIEEAREAGVSDWINEIHESGCSMLVVTKDLADRLFVQMNEVASKPSEYAFAAFDNPADKAAWMHTTAAG